MKNAILLFLACVVCGLAAACEPYPLEIAQAQPAQPVTTQIAPLSLPVTSVPTANPMPTHTVTALASPTDLPTATATYTASSVPTDTPTITSTRPAQARTPLGIATNTPRPPAALSTAISAPITLTAMPLVNVANTQSPPTSAPGGPTWTPPPADPAVQIADHYQLARPISNDGANWADRTYPYGGTSGGRLQVHHGVDMVNPRGTPILATADGTVFFAGDDLTTLFGAYNNYYGNLVVIQHAFTTFDGLPVFTLYGHMDRISVTAGQTVRQGDSIGMVGGTGIAMGPHLHLEVRVGSAYDFAATRNPELWMRPYPTFGTLAGRVTDANGAPLYSVTMTVESADIRRYAFSYADNSVNSDTQFGENFVLGDLPANYYTVTVSDNGRVRFRQTLYLYANRTTWLNMQLN